MKTDKILRRIAIHAEAYRQVKEGFKDFHEEMLDKIDNLLPSGSGIDTGCKINRELSGHHKVVIEFEYHHMADGYYTHWTSHKLIAKPNLAYDFDIKITGPDHNAVKDYLYDLFDEFLKNETITFETYKIQAND